MNGFEFALNMEQDGEKYYKHLAEINKDNSLKTVFKMLAKDEEYHAEILKKWYNKLSYELKTTQTISETKNIFAEKIDFKSEIREVPNQLDLYITALEMERQSIEIYEKFLASATEDNEKYLFENLIKQEEDHYTIIEEIIQLLKRPEEWVESAEFGVREEY